MIFLTANQVVEINKAICFEHDNRHQLYDIGKVESALHSATYPGSPPFANGGVVGIAGAIAFYVTQAHAFFDGNKRVGIASALIFLRANGYDLRYPQNPDALAELVEGCAAGKVTKEQIIEWFDTHKVKWDTGPS